MEYSVVDTNVLLVASNRASHATWDCQASAAGALAAIRSCKSLVLDQGWEILQEYSRTLQMHVHRPRGPGEEFFIWASRAEAVRLVRLERHPGKGYAEFPDASELASFDEDDRKFVAATIKSGVDRTELVNAVDSDYQEHVLALREAGVTVRELCPDLLT